MSSVLLVEIDEDEDDGSNRPDVLILELLPTTGMITW